MLELVLFTGTKRLELFLSSRKNRGKPELSLFCSREASNAGAEVLELPTSLLLERRDVLELSLLSQREDNSFSSRKKKRKGLEL